MDYEICCREIFKSAFEEFKKSNTVKEKLETKLSEVITKDNIIFTKIQTGFKIINNLLKFAIIIDEKYFEESKCGFNSNEDFIKTAVNLPKSQQDLIQLYIKYPRSIELIKDELHFLVEIEEYKGLLIINNINPMLYYNTINDNDASFNIEFFEDDCKELFIIIEKIIKKLFPIYIGICKNENKQSSIEENK